MTNFFESLAVFTGAIVGAGIFALPYLAARSGLAVIAVYFLIAAILVILVNFLLAEVSCDTHRIARIPGYAEEYLGRNWRNFSLIVSFLELTGALLAYLIVGGQFFTSYFAYYFGGSKLIYTLIYFLAGAVLIYRGIKSITQTEIIMFLLFIIILLLFFSRGLPYFDFKNLAIFDAHYLFFPYGAVLFSLWGLSIVPEIKEMVGRNRRKLRWVIGLGVVLSALYYFLFVSMILGVSGAATSADALSGFMAIVGNHGARLGFVFGVLATFTSFIALGLTLKKILVYDLKISEKTAWFFACFPALTLYLLGMNNFINIISVTGAIMLGLEAIIVIFIYKKFLEIRFQRQPCKWIYLLAGSFLIGLFLQIFSSVLFK